MRKGVTCVLLQIVQSGGKDYFCLLGFDRIDETQAAADDGSGEGKVESNGERRGCVSERCTATGRHEDGVSGSPAQHSKDRKRDQKGRKHTQDPQLAVGAEQEPSLRGHDGIEAETKGDGGKITAGKVDGAEEVEEPGMRAESRDRWE